MAAGGNISTSLIDLIVVLVEAAAKQKTQLVSVQQLSTAPLSNTMMEPIHARIALVDVRLVAIKMQFAHSATLVQLTTLIQILVLVLNATMGSV